MSQNMKYEYDCERCGKSFESQEDWAKHVNNAHPDTRSTQPARRTTIPLEICMALDLQPGSVLDWEIQEENNEKLVIIRKVNN
jgi:hypothetical protein